MKKVKYLFRRIINMNYKGFFETLNKVHDKTTKNRIYLFFDMIVCGLKYQAGYVDYNLFEMYKMNKYERSTIITRGINNELIAKYNNPKYMHFFNDKIEFNKTFNKYLKRDWMSLKESSLQDFKKFCKKHKQIIVKPVSECCGKGVECIETTSINIEDLYNKLKDQQRYLVEEVAVQCKTLSTIHPYSVNTIRVVTILGRVVTAYLRIGNNKNTVDNFNHGGMVAPINIETGIIEYEAITKQGQLYSKHPLTNKKIVGVKIPKWEAIKKLCEEASLEIPEVGYIAWDVCVGETECFFIEGNEFPGHDLYQLPPHRTGNTGLLPVFLEAIEKETDK